MAGRFLRLSNSLINLRSATCIERRTGFGNGHWYKISFTSGDYFTVEEKVDVAFFDQTLSNNDDRVLDFEDVAFDEFTPSPISTTSSQRKQSKSHSKSDRQNSSQDDYGF